MITPFDILPAESWVLLVSIVFLIRLYIHKKWQVLKNLNIPHEPPSILGLGNLMSLMKDPGTYFNQDLIRKKKFGLVYGFYVGIIPQIIISDPAVLKQIYIKQFSNFSERQASFKKIYGKEFNSCLTNTSGNRWKRMRHALSPAFSTSKLIEMYGIIEDCCDKMVGNLRSSVMNENGRFSTKELFGKFSMDVICSAAFGVNVHSQNSEDTLIVKMVKEKLDEVQFKSLLLLLFMLFPWTEKIAEKLKYTTFGVKMVDFLKGLVDTVIKQKQSSKEARVDFMQHMLHNEIPESKVKSNVEKGMTRTEIYGNSILMILAGYETTANTIGFLAYCLATNKDIQENLQAEIVETIENYGGLTHEAISKMKYLDMCTNESQRLYGVGIRNQRVCEKDISINGIHLPAGTQIQVPRFGLNHDEEYWDEPWEYKPERFRDMSKINPIIFAPFGAGPRKCIAMRFAITEVKMAIAKVLLNFNLDVCEDTPAPPLQLTFRKTLQSKEELFLKVVQKNYDIN